MTRPSGQHLSPDEFDACLSGITNAECSEHLENCDVCREQLRADRELAEQIAALPLVGPKEGFSDRVMASVFIPDPFAIRSLQDTRRRLLSTPRSLAFAATLMLVLVGSMAGSIVWSLEHQDTLASIGSWLFAQTGQALWIGVQGVASNVIEQPWYTGFRSLVENPIRLAVISAAVSFVYLGGLLVLRRLLALPTQRVAHAGV
jgi:predicted anti-sigma-YlaC factor YlaD